MLTNDFRSLKVWHKAMDLCTEVYSLVKLLPKEETYALSDQMRRSVVSIPSNIAEGHGRNSDKENLKFLSIARGSLLELETQIEICHRVNYFGLQDSDKTKNLIIEVSKMLNGLMAYKINKLSAHNSPLTSNA